VRILFSFMGGAGHLNPLLPIGHAAREAGHEVAFAGKGDLMPTVTDAGFTGLPTRPPSDGPPARTPLQAPDAEHEAKVVRVHFAGRGARERADALLRLSQEWHPDLIVYDEMDFGAAVVAERLGLPHASVVVIAAGAFVRREEVSPPLNALRAVHGLPPDPDLAMLGRYLVLAPVPPGYRDPRDPLPVTTHYLHPFPRGQAPLDDPPAWLADIGPEPIVYLTLGTVFHLEAGDLMARLITALRSMPITLIATVGREIDPAEFGPQPANVRIERYVAQAHLLPRCHLVISHGGSGTVIGALAHGLPQVVIPLGADQLNNAARCRDLGLGRVLDVMTITPEAIRAAASDALANPAYRQRAAEFQAEIAALPGPEHAVALLERLVSVHRPPEASIPS
jgi:UDP:flavonoid glycosyltransferase YjiC (YdhE family)